LASLRAHHQNHAVIWPIVKKMSGGVILGSFLFTFIASRLKGIELSVLFSLFMGYVVFRLFHSDPKKTHTHVYLTQPQTSLIQNIQKQQKNNWAYFFVAFGIGGISALVSIGGGSLTVPYLVEKKISIKKAIGTSAAIGLPLSLAGTLGYIINGWNYSALEKHIFGFIYLPAVFLIAIGSLISAPYGAKYAHYLPIKALKKIFACLLILLSLKSLTQLFFSSH
jgi:uncharacterized membrane protein YfcA